MTPRPSRLVLAGVAAAMLLAAGTLVTGWTLGWRAGAEDVAPERAAGGIAGRDTEVTGLVPSSEDPRGPADGVAVAREHVAQAPRSPTPLDGRVVDLRGNALPGIQVTLRSDQGTDIERVSDGEGRFRVADLPLAEGWEVAAQLAPRWRLWSSRGMRREGSGGWTPLLLTMVGAGEVEVQVVDALGEPVPGVQVTLEVSEVDRMARPADEEPDDDDPGRLHVERRSPTLRTGPDGWVRFQDVWADRRLVVWLLTASGRRLGPRRHLQGLLLLEDGRAPSEVILVPAGGALALRAELAGVRRSLLGRVTYPDGRPVERPALALHRVDGDADERTWKRASGRADGSFAVELDGLRLGETLRLRATDGGHAPASRSPTHAGGVDLVVADGDLEADIVVEPVLSIRGRVLDPAQPGAIWDVEAVPEPPVHPAAGAWHRTRAGEDGSFELPALAAGSYELVLSRQVHPLEVVHRFGGIPAGTSGLTLAIPATTPCSLTLTLHGPRPVHALYLLVAQPSRREAAARTWPAADAVAPRVDWPPGCPARVVALRGEIRLADGVLFNVRTDLEEVRDDPTRVQLELQPGTYALGLDAWDRDGRPFAPVLLGPARFDSGARELTLELVPTASIAGKLLDADVALGLEAIAVDAAGERLPLWRGAGPAVRSMPLAVDGRFRLDRLPAGTVLVQVGTPWALEHGGEVLTEEVTLVPDETAAIELRWLR